MICTHCENDNYPITGVPSCRLPHCTKPHDELGKRYAELSAKPRMGPNERAEFWTIKDELHLWG